VALDSRFHRRCRAVEVKDCDQSGSCDDVNISMDSGSWRRGRMVEVWDYDQNGLSGDVEIPIDSRLQRREEVNDFDRKVLSGDLKFPRSRHCQVSTSNILPGVVVNSVQRGPVSISASPPGVGRRGQDMTFVVMKLEVYCGDKVGCEEIMSESGIKEHNQPRSTGSYGLRLEGRAGNSFTCSKELERL